MPNDMPIVDAVRARMSAQPAGGRLGNGRGPLGMGFLGGSALVDLSSARERVATMIRGQPQAAGSRDGGRDNRPLGHEEPASYSEQIAAAGAREEAEGRARNWVYDQPTVV